MSGRKLHLVPDSAPDKHNGATIGLRSIGFIAKLLYEAIEETDTLQIEAVTAPAASGAQVLNYGIVPQILPAFYGVSVFRRGINIRESTIPGPG